MSNFIEIIKNQKYELERMFKIPGIIDRKQREFIDEAIAKPRRVGALADAK